MNDTTTNNEACCGKLPFAGKVALITGAAVGIGRATALKMAEEGAALILLDWNEKGLQVLRGELEAYAEKVLTVACDVSDREAVNAAVRQGLLQFQKIDILVNNAALWRDRSAFIDAPTELWERYLAINVMGVVHVTQAVLGGMLAEGYGRIINVASVAGVYGNAKMAHYSATKGALISFTKALAKEVATQGILVNAVSPGTVSSSSEPDVNHFGPSELSYLGRTGSDRENANLICFLAGDDATYINGQNIQIDGCRKKL